MNMKLPQKRWQRIAIISFLMSILLTGPWVAFVQTTLERDNYKTTARVVRHESVRSTCYGYRDYFCDRSDTLYPIYEYRTHEGKVFTTDRTYLGEVKENNLLKPLLIKDVGDEVTLYYDKNNHEQATVIAGFEMVGVYFLPLYIYLFIAANIAFYYGLYRIGMYMKNRS